MSNIEDRYPQLLVNKANMRSNMEKLVALCNPYGIRISAVTKGFGSFPPLCRTIMDAGCMNIASSRVDQLKALKEYDPSIPTMLVRIPMLSEAEDVVSFADISLVSEIGAIKRLNEKALDLGKTHKVIVMKDIGDLREGFIDPEELIEACVLTEKEMKGIKLLGIGANFNCYGSVKPTPKNLGELCSCAEEVETRIGRDLDIISGGATSSLSVILKGDIPKKVNNLRLGISIITASYAWDEDFEGRLDTFRIRAELVEVRDKPTMPIGEQGTAALNEKREYVDMGIRKRGIVAIGHQDLGNAKANLTPCDPSIKIWGSSSDHTMLDLEDCEKDYKLGDIIEFRVNYPGVLFSSMSPGVKKIYED